MFPYAMPLIYTLLLINSFLAILFYFTVAVVQVVDDVSLSLFMRSLVTPWGYPQWLGICVVPYITLSIVCCIWHEYAPYMDVWESNYIHASIALLLVALLIVSFDWTIPLIFVVLVVNDQLCSLLVLEISIYEVSFVNKKKTLFPLWKKQRIPIMKKDRN